MLRIEVQWLANRYHGAEWPPSPWRLFQAMVAGSGQEPCRNAALEAALRHLETLSAPVVTAPRAVLLRPVTSRVPDNDGDVVLALHAKGKREAAEARAAALGSLRTRRAWQFTGTVTYDWESTAETPEHLPALVRLARSVSAVGQGIDLAIARAALVEDPPRACGVRYRPSESGARLLAVTAPGGLDALNARYSGERIRVRADRVETGFEPEPRMAGYRSELDLPPVRWAAFSLRTPDDRPLIADGRRSIEVAAMVRHAIGGAAKGAGLQKSLISELMGHGGDGRIEAQPLPSVGYRHADGRIRRVLLVAPECVDEDAWRSVVSRLPGAPLVKEASGEAFGMLAPLSETDPMLGRYRGTGRRWTSATPVVLPGYDSLRGRARPERSLRRLFRHAGISESLVVRARFGRVPRLRGSAHPLSYRRPSHLAWRPCMHLTVEWTVPVRGPLSLGAGTGYGLGVFVPVDEAFLDHGRGDVEGS